MTTSFGWAGRILQVDLTLRKTTDVPTSDFEPEKFIGGQGLNTKIFWEMGCPRVDAFHPDSPLILSNGPLTGASGPFTRATICAIAPQCYPEELFTYSGFGGMFPSELKYAGYDGIVVVGKADRPVYLLIHNSDVEIRDAADLWGMDTFETQNILTDRHPKASVLTIGPAGENLSRIAIIITETSGAAGQGGYGAVMGSKNLKAIVTRGTGAIKIARPGDLSEAIRECKATGDWDLAPIHDHFRGPHLPRMESLRAEMTEKNLVKHSGCYACPYQCHGVYEVQGIGKGSQMCTDWWYAYVNPSSVEATWEGSLLCQKLGINNIELGWIGLFLERCIVETGILKKEDFGLSSIPMLGIYSEPRRSDREEHHWFLEELLGGIAEGTSPFSQGTARVAERLGEQALELYHSIFPAWGHGSHFDYMVGGSLHWATDTRDPFNSCHDYSVFCRSTDIADWFGVPGGDLEGDRAQRPEPVYDGRELQTVWVQNHQCVKNSLPICEWASQPDLLFRPPEMDVRLFESRVLAAVTGLDLDAEELWQAGERIWNLRRAIMVLREGRHRDDDTKDHNFHEGFSRFLPIDFSRSQIDPGEFEKLKDRYYKLRGWDVSTGVPTRAKLEELGMKDVADRLADVEPV